MRSFIVALVLFQGDGVLTIVKVLGVLCCWLILNEARLSRIIWWYLQVLNKRVGTVLVVSWVDPSTTTLR